MPTGTDPHSPGLSVSEMREAERPRYEIRRAQRRDTRCGGTSFTPPRNSTEATTHVGASPPPLRPLASPHLASRHLASRISQTERPSHQAGPFLLLLQQLEVVRHTDRRRHQQVVAVGLRQSTRVSKRRSLHHEAAILHADIKAGAQLIRQAGAKQAANLQYSPSRAQLAWSRYPGSA